MRMGGQGNMASSCEHVCKVGAYHDGELSATEMRRLEEHMQGCRVCADELAGLRALSGLFAAARTPVLSAEAVARLHRSVGAVPERAAMRLAGVLTAVAAAVLATCSVWIWQGGGASTPQQAQTLDWETAAVGAVADGSSGSDSEVRFAEWIVADLSRGNGYD
jgi:hypothetical protein